MFKVLIIEDDALLNKGIAFALEKENYNTISAYNYKEGLDLFFKFNPDIILLDINLPDKSGLLLCSEIRKSSKVPIIFITAKDTEEDAIKGFKLGCDDYISKPFSIELLKQRLLAVLRRVAPIDENIYKYNNIKIDFNKMELRKDDKIINLTATEFKLLELLVKNKGQVLTRNTLLQKLWDNDGNFVDENTLSVNIRRLRKKIESDSKNPQYIITVFSIGYTWGKS